MLSTLLDMLPYLKLDETQQEMMTVWLVQWASLYREDGSHVWP